MLPLRYTHTHRHSCRFTVTCLRITRTYTCHAARFCGYRTTRIHAATRFIGSRSTGYPVWFYPRSSGSWFFAVGSFIPRLPAFWFARLLVHCLHRSLLDVAFAGCTHCRLLRLPACYHYRLRVGSAVLRSHRITCTYHYYLPSSMPAFGWFVCCYYTRGLVLYGCYHTWLHTYCGCLRYARCRIFRFWLRFAIPRLRLLPSRYCVTHTGLPRTAPDRTRHAQPLHVPPRIACGCCLCTHVVACTVVRTVGCRAARYAVRCAFCGVRVTTHTAPAVALRFTAADSPDSSGSLVLWFLPQLILYTIFCSSSSHLAFLYTVFARLPRLRCCAQFATCRSFALPHAATRTGLLRSAFALPYQDCYALPAVHALGSQLRLRYARCRTLPHRSRVYWLHARLLPLPYRFTYVCHFGFCRLPHTLLPRLPAAVQFPTCHLPAVATCGSHAHTPHYLQRDAVYAGYVCHRTFTAIHVYRSVGLVTAHTHTHIHCLRYRLVYLPVAIRGSAVHTWITQFTGSCGSA